MVRRRSSAADPTDVAAFWLALLIGAAPEGATAADAWPRHVSLVAAASDAVLAGGGEPLPCTAPAPHKRVSWGL
jgi:hypothetical protein